MTMDERYFERFDYCAFEQDGKMGVLHRDGHFLIPPEHDMIHVIEADIIHIKDGGRNFLTDRNGNELRTVDFDRVRRLFWYHDPLYAVRRDGKWAIAGEGLTLLTEYEFDDVPPLGLAPLVVKKDGDWAVVEVTQLLKGGDKDENV